MNARCTALLLSSLLLLAGRAAAQSAEQTLLVGLDQLLQAGSYTWRESRASDYNGRGGVTPYGFGRTVIDGPSIATIIQPANRRWAFLLDRAVVELKDGWRRVDELTEAEMEEVFGSHIASIKNSAFGERALAAIRRNTHAPLHEVLRHLLPRAINLREENGAVVGDLEVIDAMQMQSYMNSGTPPRTPLRPPTPSLLNPRRRVSIRVPSNVQGGGTFRIALEDGKITRVTIEFTRSMAHEGKSMSMGHSFTIDVMEIGTTKVELDPKVRALLQGGP